MTPDQKVLVDVALASAIVAHGGDVVLLLPLLRQEGRALYCDPELVTKTHALVAAYQHNPVYRSAFASNHGAKRVLRLWNPFPSTRIADALRSLWARFEERLTGWGDLPTEDLEREAVPSAPDGNRKSPSSEKPVIPTPVMAQEPQKESSPEAPILPGDCGYNSILEIVVLCKRGRMVDLKGHDQGICPSCLGAFFPKKREVA